MQVTKNEKIVQVIKEETFDITGLTKAEAIALYAVVGRTNGELLYEIYLELKKQLGQEFYVGGELETTEGEQHIQNVRAIEAKINQLAQE